MSELFASIKAFIEKGNIIIFLLAVAVAIFTYQVLAKELLWAIFAFCIAYAIFYGIQNWYNDYKEDLCHIKQEREKRETENRRIQQAEEQAQVNKEHQEANLRTLYESLPEDVKEGLILLYRLPEPDGGFANSRIIREGIENIDKIHYAYSQVRIFLNLENLIEVRNSIKSTIVIISPEFYEILGEKASAK